MVLSTYLSLPFNFCLPGLSPTNMMVTLSWTCNVLDCLWAFACAILYACKVFLLLSLWGNSSSSLKTLNSNIIRLRKISWYCFVEPLGYDWVQTFDFTELWELVSWAVVMSAFRAGSWKEKCGGRTSWNQNWAYKDELDLCWSFISLRPPNLMLLVSAAGKATEFCHDA